MEQEHEQNYNSRKANYLEDVQELFSSGYVFEETNRGIKIVQENWVNKPVQSWLGTEIVLKQK